MTETPDYYCFLRIIQTTSGFDLTKRRRFGDAFLYGASGRIRTGDLLITNQLLYLLSHTSELFILTQTLFRFRHLTVHIAFFVALSYSAFFIEEAFAFYQTDLDFDETADKIHL